jgi:serine protease Do
VEALIVAYLQGDTFIEMVQEAIENTIDTSMTDGFEELETIIPSTVEALKDSVIMIVNYDETNTAVSTGSGVIYKKEGNTYYVVTNHHVVEDAFALSMIFERYGNRFFIDQEDITLIGSDSMNDIAVISFESVVHFESATFGDSLHLKVGQTVLTMGHPLGVSHFNSVTKGIISNLNREVVFEGIDTLAIQVDAAINPGNSGGALFNVLGELIGINFAKIVDLRYENIGYAIPINIVKKVIHDLENDGQLKRVTLGIISDGLSPQACEAFKGVCIMEVLDNTPASLASLNALDLIVMMKREGDLAYTEIHNFNQLRVFLMSTTYDQKIRIRYIRNDVMLETEYFQLSIHPEDQ